MEKKKPYPCAVFIHRVRISEPPADEKSPRDYFDMIFDSSLYKKIADEINLYSVQTTGKSVNTSKEEIEQFIGILVQMGVMKYPQYRMYWSPETRLPLIANVMPLQRFENLKRFFHMIIWRCQSVVKLTLIIFTKLDHCLIAFWKVVEVLNSKKPIL